MRAAGDLDVSAQMERSRSPRLLTGCVVCVVPAKRGVKLRTGYFDVPIGVLHAVHLHVRLHVRLHVLSAHIFCAPSTCVGSTDPSLLQSP